MRIRLTPALTIWVISAMYFVFEFSVGNCKCFLRAQAFSLDENGELVPEETFLQDEYLQEFEHWFAEFGRVRAKEGRSKRILEYIV